MPDSFKPVSPDDYLAFGYSEEAVSHLVWVGARSAKVDAASIALEVKLVHQGQSQVVFLPMSPRTAHQLSQILSDAVDDYLNFRRRNQQNAPDDWNDGDEVD